MWCKDHKNECYYSRQIKPCDDEITNPSPYGMSPPAPLLDIKLEIDHFFVYPGKTNQFFQELCKLMAIT